MICAIILAAGQSRRMGVQKLLLPFAGDTVIGHIVAEVLRSGIAPTFVVTGADGERVGAALVGQPVVFITNPDPAGDMLSSVRCGLRALPADCDAVLLVLGDQPTISTDLIVRMRDALRLAGGGMVVPVYRGRRGHPLLFSATFGPEILAGYDAVGLRGLLQVHAGEVHELAVTNSGVLADMDCPADYRRELRRRAGAGTAPSQSYEPVM